jgi:membrane-bound inhibitor of C-type lysozyme
LTAIDREEAMARTALLILAGTLALALAPAAQAAEATYRCDDGSTIAARFDTPASGPGQVELRQGSKAMTLPQLPSADGGRYGAGDVEFWIKGRGATFTHQGRAITCKTR